MEVKSADTGFMHSDGNRSTGTVDNSEVYNILKNNLDDFDQIKKALTGYLRQ